MAGFTVNKHNNNNTYIYIAQILYKYIQMRITIIHNKNKISTQLTGALALRPPGPTQVANESIG